MKIGLFDSGLGGLSVVKAIKEKLPNTNLVYIGDTANVPYGDKSPKTIRSLSQALLDFLVEQEVDLIAIACNTSSALLLPEHQTYKGIPVIGLLQAGCQLQKQYQSIGILATSATVASKAYVHEIIKHTPQTRCQQLACPEFVPFVESLEWKNRPILHQIKERLKPMLEQSPEAIMLGCSHYPFLQPFFKQLFPKETVFIDPAQALVEQLTSTATRASIKTEDQFYVTKKAQEFASAANQLLGFKIQVNTVHLKSKEIITQN